jgi:hypothetical protein
VIYLTPKGAQYAGHRTECSLNTGAATCDCGVWWEKSERAAFNPPTTCRPAKPFEACSDLPTDPRQEMRDLLRRMRENIGELERLLEKSR